MTQYNRPIDIAAFNRELARFRSFSAMTREEYAAYTETGDDFEYEDRDDELAVTAELLKHYGPGGMHAEIDRWVERHTGRIYCPRCNGSSDGDMYVCPLCDDEIGHYVDAARAAQVSDWEDDDFLYEQISTEREASLEEYAAHCAELNAELLGA